MHVRKGRKSEKRMLLEFHKHCGSSPADIAECWYDLCNSDVDDPLSAKEKTEKGFKRFLASQCWLWARPKNTALFASRFGVCEDCVKGKHLWQWIGRIADLCSKKIVWPEWLNSEGAAMHAIAADGVDFKMWERQHAEFPVDTKAMSQKFKACGAKCIFALSAHHAKCVFIAGPFRGGQHDIDTFRESGLMQKMTDVNKVTIADRGFKSRFAHERKQFAHPDYMDSSELHNFKSRARLRQETHNRRLKHFQCLATTFTNGFEKHGIALRAVAVMVQCQMDNGSPICCV